MIEGLERRNPGERDCVVIQKCSDKSCGTSFASPFCKGGPSLRFGSPATPGGRTGDASSPRPIFCEGGSRGILKAYAAFFEFFSASRPYFSTLPNS